MPLKKRQLFTKEEIETSYIKAGNLEGLAILLGVSYPTASRWVNYFNIDIKPQGYTKPPLPVTGL